MLLESSSPINLQTSTLYTTRIYCPVLAYVFMRINLDRPSARLVGDETGLVSSHVRRGDETSTASALQGWNGVLFAWNNGPSAKSIYLRVCLLWDC